MGIIAKQSSYNVISISFAFIIGAINMLFLYPTFLGKEFQGLIIALLANSNLIQPFISFGVQHTLIKFFSNAKTLVDRDRLLWFALIFPLLIVSLLLLFYITFDQNILLFSSKKSSLPLLIIATRSAMASASSR